MRKPENDNPKWQAKRWEHGDYIFAAVTIAPHGLLLRCGFRRVDVQLCRYGRREPTGSAREPSVNRPNESAPARKRSASSVDRHAGREPTRTHGSCTLVCRLFAGRTIFLGPKTEAREA